MLNILNSLFTICAESKTLFILNGENSDAMAAIFGNVMELFRENKQNLKFISFTTLSADGYSFIFIS